jgi:hypothetical protein
MIFFALPTSPAIIVLSSQLNSDTKFASAAIVLSTLLSFLLLERHTVAILKKRRLKMSAETSVQTFKLTIEYDGSGFHGWQRQATDRTVQETIETALTS